MGKLKIIAIMTLPALLLAGCGTENNSASNGGDNSSSSKVVNLTVWDDYSRSTPTGKAYQKLVNEFNATHPDIHVNAQYVTDGDQLEPKLETALAGNQEPDMVAGGYPTWGPGLMDSGKVVNLTPYLDSSKTLKASDFYNGMLQVSTYKGQVLSIPNDGGDYGLFYNEQIFKEAGITSPPKTWTQVAQDSKIIKQKTGKYGFYVPIGNTEWTVWTFEGMLWANGGTFIDTSGQKAKVEFNSPAGDEALQTWVSMIKNGDSPSTAYPVSMSVATYLQKNQVSMALDGPYDVPTLESAGYPLGTEMFPKGTVSTATNLGTDAFFVFKTGTAQENASWKFIEWFMQPSRLAQWDIATGFLPTETSVLNTSAYKAFLAKNPKIEPLVENLKYAQGRPTLKSYTAISTELGNYIEEAFYGKISVQTALNDAAAQAKTILTQNNE
ncbi:ABC transporter substrate-binding protein [Alicyclobacillus fastidiosus]|uniref:ABC transporter substrate-binding protein n=1 Tax=Alicyclobacillus fastidiosus TaxID=392011 RepID=A0ABV5AJE9_9BACL|nr:ABC transporter substrate-binding protein [Alicyclobacillus fastidiosus]WEH08353.1 ABC transporter substrate-binding protein [Alicyclobacillus fastidiosus]